MIARQDPIKPTVQRGSVGRVAVVLVVLGWLLLVSPVPFSLQGTGMLIVLSLVGLDVVLGITTGWLAFAPSSRLDERQRMLRDSVYRIAFRLIAAGVLLMAMFGIVAMVLAGERSGIQRPVALSPRYLMALLEMLAILPTAAVAWFQATRLDEADDSTNPKAWWILLSVPLLTIVWGVGTQLVPAQTVIVRGTPRSFMADELQCDEFTAKDQVLAGFGGSLGFHAAVCWDGQRAYIYGDPTLGEAGPPRPAGVPADPQITSCSPADTDTDFATVDQHCSARLDPNGTVRMHAHGRVSSLPFGLASRDLDLELVVARDGKLG